MNKPAQPTARGIAGLAFTSEEKRHPLFKRIAAAMADEKEFRRSELEHVQNIESTTLLRGRLQAVNQILARLSHEVGPESRQSEGDAPESAIPALVAERFPVSFEQ